PDEGHQQKEVPNHDLRPPRLTNFVPRAATTRDRRLAGIIYRGVSLTATQKRKKVGFGLTV
ncbi:hypothetical protein, partial [Salmonella enterica]|uniref:hypothetical protein n=1 Tax=Salmonella enterica TaxID=28901 RepID=UPI003CF42530